jgi:hypothetical protein
VPAFFGLTPTDREIYLEHSFLLMYYMGFSYWECYNLPIQYRVWFLQRLQKELKGSNDSRAAHANSPDARTMTNKARGQVPAKLRRFT